MAATFQSVYRMVTMIVFTQVNLQSQKIGKNSFGFPLPQFQTLVLLVAAFVAAFFSTPLTDPKQLPTQEFLKCSVQEIITDLNSKRKRDAALLEGVSNYNIVNLGVKFYASRLFG